VNQQDPGRIWQHLLQNLRHQILPTAADRQTIAACTQINLQRVYYASFIAMPVHLIHIVLFWLTEPGSDWTRQVWRNGIIIAHTLLLLAMILINLLSRPLLRRDKPTWPRTLLQYAAITIILAAGVAIAAIDQLVTTNVTPYLIVCLLCGMLFLLRPLLALIFYLGAYAAYYLSLGLVIDSADILLSNRVNGITAVAIAFTLSLLMWHSQRVQMEQRRQIDEQQALLARAAYYDSLTNLPNRRFFDDIIQKELAAIHRYQRQSCLIILDIDRFKQLNDQFGHPGGDQILSQLAEVLRENIRQADTIARLGGEEFIILLSDTPLTGAVQTAEKLRHLIAAFPFSVDNQIASITASFGVSRLIATESQMLFGYYAHADQALYLAKERGRNRVEVLEAHPADIKAE
jgi:diguanylate cyclase (GGDEF)-like protein